MLDLEAAGAVELGDGEHVVATAAQPPDPVLAGAWQAIADNGTPRTLRAWMLRPTLLVKGLPHVVYDRLVERGVLSSDGKTRIFRRDRYEEIDQRSHQELVASLGEVLDGGHVATGDELLLLAMLPVCRLTSAVFPDRDRRATESRIKELLADDADAGDVAANVARAAAGDVAAAVAAGVAAASTG